MRVLRGRAGILASFALTWQIFALMLVPTAACCRPGAASAAGGEMANCPMHHSAQDAPCPMHAQAAADRECPCPRLGCAPSDNGAFALLGPIGVLPPPTNTPALARIGDVAILTPPSSQSLAPVPVAPPPRV
jgi:hypothetical protein